MTDQAEMDVKLEQARELVRCLEAGETESADKVLNQLTRLQEGPMFTELGRLTRELHEAINGFLLDERLQSITEHEIKDAAERLRYVIDMTENSANSTLNAVEAGMPLVQGIEEKARQLEVDWGRFCSRELNVQEFRQLSETLAAFLHQLGSDTDALQARLNEVLMAQGFQDLTGQIIRKVIDLVQDVEDKLVQIIRISGSHQVAAAKPAPEKAEVSPIEASGPVVPGVDKGDVVHGQDDVDDLLSSLGF